MDNAVHACERLAGEGKGFVNISGYRRGDFFLARVEGELSRKDNDTYRRQNVVVS